MKARASPKILGSPGGQRCASCDVRQQSVCSCIGEADLARLDAVAISLQVDKGVTFIDEGQPATDFFNVTEGTVKLYKLLADGRQQITGFAQVGHFLGLAMCETYAFSAEALEPVRLCRFPGAQLRGLLDECPALERRLLDTACNELATAQEQMLLLGRKTARERVASFLLALSAQPCGHGQDNVRLPMTRRDIGDYLGLTVETVSRVLSRMTSERRIALGGDRAVTLLDRRWLEAVAAGEMGATLP